MNNMFADCQLERLELPKSIRIINANAFMDCHKLEYVSTDAQYIGDSAFLNCSNLDKVVLTNENLNIDFDYPGSYIFDKCSKLNSAGPLSSTNPYKDKDGNTPCDFIEIEVWNTGASFLEQYAGKGCMVSVQGSIRLNTYEDKEGNKRYKTFVQGDRVNLIATPPAPREEEFKALTAKPKKQTYQRKK